jgi:hypothetical protein
MHIKLSDEPIRENSDGTCTFVVDFDVEFRDWFLKDQGLKRMSQKRLEKWIVAALHAYLDSAEVKKKRKRAKSH